MSTDFIQFASERGLIISSLVFGKWARVPTVDHPRKTNGAYFFAGDFGHCQNWAIQESVDSWQDKKERTPFEQKELSRRISESTKALQTERENNQRKAAKKANWILSQCHLDRHGYLEKKGFVDAFGNVWKKDENSDPTLCVPMFCDGEICGLQMISSIGEKKFLFGQRTNDAYFKIGDGEKIFICEGYATGLSLNAALSALKVRSTIYVTFSVGNAKRIAKRFPMAILVADNDASLVGQTAAQESGLKWWMSDAVGEDFNDYQARVGKFRSAQALRKLVF